MRWITLILSCLLWQEMAFASDFTGVYTFSKGLNKANGTLYIYQWNSDSAFIILQAVSGMPDFFTVERKGFIRIENNVGSLDVNDSCRAQLHLNAGTCQWTEAQTCKTDFSIEAKYKRTTNKLKKGSSFMPGLEIRNGIVNRDSVVCYAGPHRNADRISFVSKSQEIQISDEYNGFYMIELPSRPHDFLWVPKKQINVSR